MLKKLIHFLASSSYLFLYSALFADANYSIVFIHIGNKIPEYTETALLQARLFNPECPIILIANDAAIQDFPLKDEETNITYVACESLIKLSAHQAFIKQTTLDDQLRNGFWRYTSERFLYLQDLMVQQNLTNVFHLEYDNMLYVNLQDLLPIFTEHYKAIAATFDNDKRCIPGFMFIQNPDTMTTLANFFSQLAKLGYNDMEVLGRFRKRYGKKVIDNLPIISEAYVRKNLLISPMNHVARNKWNYCQNIELFNSIFDAAALGQYLGGIDPSLYGSSSPGFINESCVFNPSLLTYEWIADEANRSVPYAVYAGTRYRINNLHIHSKKLELFKSIP